MTPEEIKAAREHLELCERQDIHNPTLRKALDALDAERKENERLRGALDLLTDCDETRHRFLNGRHMPDCALCGGREALKEPKG